MSAKLDISDYSIVVWCNQCPEFGESASDISGAHDIAVEHEQREHPAKHSAEENRAYFKRKQVAITQAA